MAEDGPVLRIFEVKTKPGCTEKLLENFSTKSADVVQHEPGNKGYFFGEFTQGAEDTVMFVSIWKNIEAVKKRFGDDWQVSYLPEGYEDLIETCSIRHLHTGSGWHIDSRPDGSGR